MAGWREFRSRDGSVRFDVLERRFVRYRARSLDDHRGRAYLIVDLFTLREVSVEHRPPRQQPGAGETHRGNGT